VSTPSSASLAPAPARIAPESSKSERNNGSSCTNLNQIDVVRGREGRTPRQLALDVDSRELLRKGKRVHLSSKAFQLLDLLLRNRPRALSKAELMESLWPGVCVLESNRAGLMAEIRKVLGQSGRTGVVRTVHTFGYAFDAEAVEDVGRDPSLPVLVDATTVSWHQARLHLAGSATSPTVTVEDQGSRNGTFVNSARVSSPTAPADGDELRLGSVVVRVRLAGSEHRRTDPIE
jgi:DNA-binding winged helix-turn-helix (wHTH) protein